MQELYGVWNINGYYKRAIIVDFDKKTIREYHGNQPINHYKKVSNKALNEIITRYEYLGFKSIICLG